MGGVVGGLVLLAALAFVIWHFCINPRRRKAVEAEAAAAAANAAETVSSTSAQPGQDDSAFHKAELATSEAQRAEMEDPAKNQWRVEADGSIIRPKNELDGTSTPTAHEMEGRTFYEMDGKRYLFPVEADGRGIEVHEMPAREEIAAEMGAQEETTVPQQTQAPRWSWVPSPGAPRGTAARRDSQNPR